MATAMVLPQIEVQSLAADVEQTRDELEKEKESHLSINYISYDSDKFHNRHELNSAKSLVEYTQRWDLNLRAIVVACGHQRQ